MALPGVPFHGGAIELGSRPGLGKVKIFLQNLSKTVVFVKVFVILLGVWPIEIQ